MGRNLARLIGFGAAALLLAGNPSVWGQVTSMGAIATGEIVSVDPQNDLLLVKTGRFESERFKITDQTRISHNRQALQLEQLRPGNQVRVEYTEKGGQKLASSVEVVKEARGASEPQAGKAGQSSTDSR